MKGRVTFLYSLIKTSTKGQQLSARHTIHDPQRSRNSHVTCPLCQAAEKRGRKKKEHGLALLLAIFSKCKP